MLIRIVIVALAYLLGSIPVSYLIARFAGRMDLRAVGSGNVGATNVYRALGPGWAVLAFLGDALKGALPVLAALVLFGRDPTASWWTAGAGLLAVLGHLFPPWLKFRGGKGVATSFGVMLALSPWAALLAFALWAALAVTLKISSVASLVAALSLPGFVYFLDPSPAVRWLALILTVLIFVSHHENLGRLIRGEEKAIQRNQPDGKPEAKL